MKKLATFGAACAVALGAGGVAQAGTEATDASGNYLSIDAALSPPATSTKRTASAVTATFHVAFGNKRSGSPFPAAPDVEVTFPKGTVYNGADLPQCPLPTSADEIAQSNRCGTLQRVGGGTAEVDARGLGVTAPIEVGLTAYNGELRDGKPTLVIFAENDSGIKAEIDFEFDANKMRLFDPSGSTARIQYSFSKFDLGFGRTYKFKERGKTVRVTLLEAPTRCSRLGWQFGLTASKSDGFSLTATDDAPCLTVRD